MAEHVEEDRDILTENSLLSRGPLVFTLMLMCSVGLAVNMLVIVVFLKRFPASAIRSFVVTMSFSDLVATAVAIPLHLFTLFKAYNFHSPIVCKLYFTVMSLSTNCSSFVIVLFAIDRLRRVRTPVFKEMDTIRSYYQVGAVVSLAVVVTVPFVPMYGSYTAELDTHFNGPMCWLDDAYVDTFYPIVYQAVLSVTFVVGLGLMIFSYSMISVSIHDLAKEMQEELEYKRLHPPPPSKFADFYVDTPSERSTSAISHKSVVVEVGKVDDSSPRQLTFAERLHGPRTNRSTLNVPSEAGAGGQRPSKIKKISNAIQQFFVPPAEESESSSSENSSFVSQRMDGSFAKTMTAPHVISPETTRENVQTAAGLKPPKKKKAPSNSSADNDSTKKATKPIAASSPLDRNQSADSQPDGNVDRRDSHGAKTDLPKPQAQSTGAKIEGTTTPTTESVVTGRAGAKTDKPADKDNTAPPETNAADQRAHKVSTTQRRSRAESESLETLEHLHTIKTKATQTMITLTVLYVITWLPNLVSRILDEKPANLCHPSDDCWINAAAYSVCSVYINSVVNPFMYCLGSVHFRKQLSLFIKPCKDKCCKRRARRRVVRRVTRKEKNPNEEEHPPNEEDNSPKEGGSPPKEGDNSPKEGGSQPKEEDNSPKERNEAEAKPGQEKQPPAPPPKDEAKEKSDPDESQPGEQDSSPSQSGADTSVAKPEVAKKPTIKSAPAVANDADSS